MKVRNRFRLIVGLGNPGAEYKGTRHNAGFMLVNSLSRTLNISLTSSGNSVWGEGSLKGSSVILLKPQLYMNRSGNPLKTFISNYGRNIDTSEIMVAYDDMDLDLGCVRIRKKGGSGGHNGIGSIIEALGTEKFIRLRLGIGRHTGNGADYVLGRFNEREQETWENTVKMAHDAAFLSITESISIVMNRFNSTSKNCIQEEARKN